LPLTYLAGVPRVENPLVDNLAFIFAGAFIALLFVQWKWPLRRQHFFVLKRMLRNALVAAPSFLVSRVLLIPIPFLVSIWARDHHVGLFNWLHLPLALPVIAGVLIYDYAYYWWHQLMHLVLFFWRFHNVHHTDLDMDVTTASRFHFGEVFVSIFFRVGMVALFGFDVWTLAAYEVLFSLATQFHHSNWRLPIKLERWLNRFVVTPRMHGTHHSIVQRETNSNWGTVFSWWDRWHGTLRIDVPQDAITIGVAAYRRESELTFGKLLLLPFQKQRPWRLPDGKIPERSPRETRELAL
jgi:sterol desaturase/sphingolipid hydroxylase (fatty acid hydroxylase superfamily)